MRHAVILAFDPGEALRPLTSEETPTAFLALGEGGFERAILTALARGHTTDCAVGQAATLLGVVFGASQLHDTWRAPIGEALDTHVIGFERINSDLPTDWTTRCGKEIASDRFVLSGPGGREREPMRGERLE